MMFNKTLPLLAKENKWGIYYNHCLMRVALDNYFGCVWYEKLDQKKGALKSMNEEQIKGVLELAKKMQTNGTEYVKTLNHNSLNWYHFSEFWCNLKLLIVEAWEVEERK